MEYLSEHLDAIHSGVADPLTAREGFAVYGAPWFDPPEQIFICSCGHDESAHERYIETTYNEAVHPDAYEEYEVETYPCVVCNGLCQDFEVWS